MHRYAWLILLASASTAAQVDIGARLHSNQVSHKNNAECVTSPSQRFACVENVDLGGVRFDVVEYDDKRDIRYLFTTDAKFSTHGGQRVGDWVTVSERDVILVPGWHILGPRTPDGWRMVLGFDPDKAQPLHFEDGVAVNLVRTAEAVPHQGRLRIVGFEKGTP